MYHLLGGADRIAVVDVETTGLGASDEIVELAVVTLDGAGTEVAVLDTLVRASRPIGPGASQVNGLRDADLAGAPSSSRTKPRSTCGCSGRPYAASGPASPSSGPSTPTG